MTQLFSADAVQNTHGFTIETDLNETISVDFGINSVVECLIGSKGSVLEGVETSFELIRNDQNIKLLKERGKFHYRTISYAQNMEGFTSIENRDDAYTHLFAYAFQKSNDSNKDDVLITTTPRTIAMWEYEGGAVNICPRDFTDDVFFETHTINTTNLNILAKRHAQKMKSSPPFKYEVDLAKIKLKTDEELKAIGIGDRFRLINKMYNITTNVKVTELVIDSLTHTPLSVILEQY